MCPADLKATEFGCAVHSIIHRGLTVTDEARCLLAYEHDPLSLPSRTIYLADITKGWIQYRL